MNEKILIYTDASLKNGRAAWGAIIIRKGEEPLKASGEFKAKATTCTLELRAIANALHRGLHSRIIQPGDIVTVRTDSQNAARAMGGHRRRLKRKGRAHYLATSIPFNEAADTLVAYARKFEIKLNGEWVKGHQNVPNDPSSIFNREADYLCGVLTGSKKVRHGQALAHANLLLDRALRTLFDED